MGQLETQIIRKHAPDMRKPQDDNCPARNASNRKETTRRVISRMPRLKGTTSTDKSTLKRLHWEANASEHRGPLDHEATPLNTRKRAHWGDTTVPKKGPCSGTKHRRRNGEPTVAQARAATRGAPEEADAPAPPAAAPIESRPLRSTAQRRAVITHTRSASRYHNAKYGAGSHALGASRCVSHNLATK